MGLRLPPLKYKMLCAAVLLRDNYKCRSCGHRSNLHVHHVVFRSQQGEDTPDNLVTLCNSCHDGVHKDIKDGQYGLTIVKEQVVMFDYKGPPIFEWKFIRRPGWRPK